MSWFNTIITFSDQPQSKSMVLAQAVFHAASVNYFDNLLTRV
jgi:hypothetical protein